MAYDPGALEIALAAAVGDDPALIGELRQAFMESVQAHADAMSRAQTAADWRAAAWRLKGVAASFGATRLMAIAEEASETAPGDAGTLHRVSRAISGFHL
jgi:HPt (histidine-containing phosphotransfer) domain-containing protein